MTRTETQNTSWRVLLIAALVVVLLGLMIAASAAHAAEPDSRLDRKIRVMEKVLDEVLVQSEHVTVSPAGNVRGLVLDEFGALFIIDGSLGADMLFAGSMPIEIGEGEGNTFTYRFRNRSRERDSEDYESWEEWQAEADERRQKSLAGLKSELVDALIDYGATLGELDADRWVALVAFLDGHRLLGRGDAGSRLTIKVKMSDLRLYASGALSREGAVERVVVEGP